MGEKLAMQPAWQKASPRLVRRYLTREALGLVVMGAALFWSAGRLDWWPGGWTGGRPGLSWECGWFGLGQRISSFCGLTQA